MDESQTSSLSAGKAVLVGHIAVSIPVLTIMCGFLIVGLYLFRPYWLLFFFIGFVLAWLWWSFYIPQWRSWALRNGVQEDKLQKLAAITGLVWPKGSVFEKTEFKIDD